VSRDFNDLLKAAGIAPEDVCVIRHHTPEGGKDHDSLHDLWRDDPAGFSRYQATQDEGRPLFRGRKIWAAFVCPNPNETMFIGLFEATLSETRKADWSCDYRGDAPGDGEPIDIFKIRPRPELAEHAEVLRVDWPMENRRSWARKAEGLSLPIPRLLPAAPSRPLTGEALVAALERQGFATCRTTKKVVQLRRGDLIIYVKRETQTRPLVLHPHFLGIADDLRALDGVDVADPARTYINSNLREFPVYLADHRKRAGRHGFAIGVNANRLPAFIDFIDGQTRILTPEGEVRVIAPEEAR
jgi:hypothetical protein